jgi:2',3'-cyclic-nucleotide 2'-phosphodiesterase (5'-nucleotidase family)
MIKKVSLLFSVLALAACSRQLTVTQVNYVERRMTDSLTAFDPRVESVIKPYRDSMEAEMKQVLVINDTVLTKQMPESDLGNLLAEILLQKSQQYTHQNVDVAIINFGGIRITQLHAGKVTYENAFELMPFDNKIVLLQLDGATAQKLFDKMAAAGGVPLAGARYVIDGGKATHITIKGKDFDAGAKYSVAISDYLANGGDNLDILKPIPQISTNKLLRDAFIEGFKDINARGEHLKSIKDGRVTLIHNN